MISTDMFLDMQSGRGSNLGHIKRQTSNMVMNDTFTRDYNYKKVYILTRDGWKFEDAKFQIHATPSIAKDDVDSYLQFRPKVHYPLGSYVLIPDDVTDPDLDLTEDQLLNPFSQPVSDRNQWWLIVDRTDYNENVRYSVLKCNYEFKWVYKGEIFRTYGIVRNANSYTSGIWRDEISVSFDDLNGAWLPNVYFTYRDKMEEFHLDDTRTIQHMMRFVVSLNEIVPKVYTVTKVNDMSPQGIIKLSIKQSSLNYNRDNYDLGICDYYNDSGEILVEHPVIDSDIPETEEPHVSNITSYKEDTLGELTPVDLITILSLGKKYYYNVQFSDNEQRIPDWRVSLVDEEGLYEDNRSYYENLIKLNVIDNSIVELTVGKANSLVGKQFILSVSDLIGDYHSSINLEVSK